jgi:2-aminobenzoate-CoA ligase
LRGNFSGKKRMKQASPHPSAHLDRFCADNLPSSELQPVYLFNLPEVQYPEALNCADELLGAFDHQGQARAKADRVAIYFDAPAASDTQADKDGHTKDDQAPTVLHWTYAELEDQVNRIANVLHDAGVVPGNRVLLRGLNGPLMAASWLAVVKAGLVAVPTMPMLRAKELKQIIDKAQVSFALCEDSLMTELEHNLNAGHEQYTRTLKSALSFGALQQAMRSASPLFKACPTHRDDTCLIAFTSGTTGEPKGTMHFHRDVLAMSDLFPSSVLHMTENDIVIGTPPLAFTFGLGGLLTFAMRHGAATVLNPKYTPESLMQGIERFKATLCFTAPTFYRQMATFTERYSLRTLRHTISAGEALPLPVRKLWFEKTGIAMTDGIGGTEMIHIYIASPGDELHAAGKWGALGKVVPGYEARIVDEHMQPLPFGQVGKLAVRGPTGCRYLADPRQSNYVKAGWNLPGDTFSQDEEGYFYYHARNDDMIISAGYNIAGPEVEAALMEHESVLECAVIGTPDEERGQIVHAFVVLKEDVNARAASQSSTPSSFEAKLTKQLQDHVKQSIAPFKYPRRISFCKDLPRTETGKLQRFKLRDLMSSSATPAATPAAPPASNPHKVLQPEGWIAPKGYANGIEAHGRQIYVAGMVGWNGQCQFESDDFVKQTEQALQNVLDTLACSKAGPEHMVRMTWYVKSKKEYLARGKEIGAIYKRLIGRNYPAMTLVQVVDLVEDRALLEIEVTAVIPD